MDSTALLNALTITISVAALAVSVVTATRQSKIMQRSNQLPVIVDLMQEFRTAHFQESERYVLETLTDEHDASVGCTNLPGPARLAVETVTSFFSGVGALRVYDMVEEQILVTTFGYRADRAWTALEQRIRHERELRKDSNYASCFEDLISCVRDGWPPAPRYRLQLRTLPQQDPTTQDPTQP
jgi:hypothetical protein